MMPLGLRLTLVVTLFALPRIASAGHGRVAVVPGIAVNLDAARVDALSQDLAEALSAELDIDAIGGLEVRRRLPITGLPPDCVASPACINDLAKRLDAQELLFVVMVDTGTGGAIQVDSTWVDPATHRSVPRPAIDIVTLRDAKSRFVSAAQKLLPDVPVRTKPNAGGIGRMSAPVPRHLTMATYLTAGAAAVGLGAGVTFGLVTRSKYKTCEDMASTGVGCTQSRKDAIRRIALVADAGWFVLFGGAVATAVVYATSGEASHVIVEPIPGGAAVTASGSF
ncbi:MAG TPA: hypothetical protein VHN14_15825 [Kofleriaceae bacterium]|nr:hypothetical protein [Kofleriaceae bacterium]